MLFDPKWKTAETTEPWRDLLHRAADLIERHGHVKEEVGSVHKGFCVFGALNYAETQSSTDSGWHGMTALDAMGREPECADYNQNVIVWNNQAETTAEQVVALMRRVADVQTS